ncbi:uncharacterized protein LOC116343134 [Contarinia nasturtii]|uniref:uncharacterized protein LOC116343134 n=1 Tax=Contarinia nasturtii TaxID=265458 RepID=UPI0012D3FB2D|nr:uncharacterized protein LOC116343134 [Contarinia nasturtii]
MSSSMDKVGDKSKKLDRPDTPILRRSRRSCVISNERKLKCCSVESSLKTFRHELLYTAWSEKQFECSVCHKKFVSKLNLNKHQIKHRKLNKWCCSECPEIFECSDDVYWHERIHHWIDMLELFSPFKYKESKLIFQSDGVEKKLKTIPENIDDELKASSKDSVDGTNSTNTDSTIDADHNNRHGEMSGSDGDRPESMESSSFVITRAIHMTDGGTMNKPDDKVKSNGNEQQIIRSIQNDTELDTENSNELNVEKLIMPPTNENSILVETNGNGVERTDDAIATKDDGTAHKSIETYKHFSNTNKIEGKVKSTTNGGLNEENAIEFQGLSTRKKPMELSLERNGAEPDGLNSIVETNECSPEATQPNMVGDTQRITQKIIEQADDIDNGTANQSVTTDEKEPENNSQSIETELGSDVESSANKPNESSSDANSTPVEVKETQVTELPMVDDAKSNVVDGSTKQTIPNDENNQKIISSVPPSIEMDRGLDGDSDVNDVPTDENFTVDTNGPSECRAESTTKVIVCTDDDRPNTVDDGTMKTVENEGNGKEINSLIDGMEMESDIVLNADKLNNPAANSVERDEYGIKIPAHKITINFGRFREMSSQSIDDTEHENTNERIDSSRDTLNDSPTNETCVDETNYCGGDMSSVYDHPNQTQCDGQSDISKLNIQFNNIQLHENSPCKQCDTVFNCIGAKLTHECIQSKVTFTPRVLFREEPSFEISDCVSNEMPLEDQSPIRLINGKNKSLRHLNKNATPKTPHWDTSYWDTSFDRIERGMSNVSLDQKTGDDNAIETIAESLNDGTNVVEPVTEPRSQSKTTSKTKTKATPKVLKKSVSKKAEKEEIPQKETPNKQPKTPRTPRTPQNAAVECTRKLRSASRTTPIYKCDGCDLLTPTLVQLDRHKIVCQFYDRKTCSPSRERRTQKKQAEPMKIHTSTPNKNDANMPLGLIDTPTVPKIKIVRSANIWMVKN